MNIPPPFPTPPTPFDSLIAPMSPEAILQTFIDALVFANIRADLWPTEGVMISCMTAIAKVISGGINDRIAASKSGLLPLSFAGWLAWLALYFYGVVKVQGTFATGSVRLDNDKGGSFAQAAFTTLFQNTTTKAVYTNTEPISLPPGPGTFQLVDIQATVIGSSSNALPGDITTIQSPAMQGVRVTNLAPVLGTDDQPDEDLRLTCWYAISANSPFGPANSFAYAVKTAKNLTLTPPAPVNINRLTISPPDHTGGITVTLASPGGVPISTDVDAVRANILAIAKPPGVRPVVQGATPVNDTDAIIVYVSATPGLVAATVVAAMNVALEAFFAAYPIGGRSVDGASYWLFATAVDGVLFAAWPGVFAVSGTHDLALSAGQVAVDETTIRVVLQ